MTAKVHIHMHVSDLAKSREFYRAFFGAARASDAVGNRAQAAEYFGKLVNLAKNADAERQEVREAKAFLARR